MNKQYKRGDEVYKVTQIKGSWVVYDSLVDKFDKKYYVANFGPQGEEDAIELARNLNIKYTADHDVTIDFIHRLQDEAHAAVKESLWEFTDNLIVENLRDWFKPHTDKRTGKRFKGWINCRTGGPCSSKSKSGKYPACRPTHQQCKKIKGKMHKKTSSKRVSWK